MYVLRRAVALTRGGVVAQELRISQFGSNAGAMMAALRQKNGAQGSDGATTAGESTGDDATPATFTFKVRARYQRRCGAGGVGFGWRHQLSWSARSLASPCRRVCVNHVDASTACVVEWVYFGLCTARPRALVELCRACGVCVCVCVCACVFQVSPAAEPLPPREEAAAVDVNSTHSTYGESKHTDGHDVSEAAVEAAAGLYLKAAAAREASAGELPPLSVAATSLMMQGVQQAREGRLVLLTRIKGRTRVRLSQAQAFGVHVLSGVGGARQLGWSRVGKVV